MVEQLYDDYFVYFMKGGHVFLLRGVLVGDCLEFIEQGVDFIGV